MAPFLDSNFYYGTTSTAALFAAAGASGPDYTVGADDPETVADFAGVKNSGVEYYRVAGSETDFDTMFTYGGSSLGSMTDSDGNVKWKPHNLVKYSTDYTSGTSAWDQDATQYSRITVTTGQTDPDGGSNASKIVVSNTSSSASDAYLRQNIVGGTTNIPYTISAFCKSSGYDYAVMSVGTFAGNYYAIFNLSSGTVATSPGDAETTASITSVGDGWYLCEVTCTDDGGLETFIITPSPDNTITTTSNGTDGILIYGLHAYRSDLGGMVDNPDRGDSYVPTTTAAVYLSRRNHYRYTGASYAKKGILLESAAATNSCTSSTDLTTTWTVANTDSITITSDQGTGPDGNTSLDKLAITDTTNEHHDIRFTFTGTAANWTGSVYVDDVDQQYVGLRFYTSANEWAVAVFNLTAGTVTQESDGSGTTAIVGGEIEQVASGLYRISITATLTAASTIFAIQTHSGATPTLTSTDGTEAYAGAGTESFYAGFVNIELGSVPTSHIPTSGATVTRSAETLTIAGANMAASTTAMSFHMQGELNYTDDNLLLNEEFYRWFASASNSLSATNRTNSTYTGALRVIQVAAGTSDDVTEALPGSYSPGINVAINIASRHTSGAINGAADGTAATANTTPTALADLSSTAFELGYDYTGTIALFRQSDADWGDSGIATATS